MSSTSFANIDCFEYMRNFVQDNSIQLIVTDPPYGIGFDGVTSDTSWDKLDYEAFLAKFLTEVKRILTDDGTLWMCCGRTQIPTVFRVIEKVGLKCNLENWLTYARQKGRGASKKLKSQAEEILHITKSNKYT